MHHVLELQKLTLLNGKFDPVLGPIGANCVAPPLSFVKTMIVSLSLFDLVSASITSPMESSSAFTMAKFKELYHYTIILEVFDLPA